MSNGMMALSIFGMGADLYNADQNRDAEVQNNLINYKRTRAINQQNRDWAVQDWEKTNDYNSPAQQMQRLKEAGLNPHLVYGKGADNIAAPMRTPQSNPYHSSAPQFRFSGRDAANSMIVAQQAELQADNLRKQNMLLDQQITGAAIANDKSSFDLDFNKKLAGIRSEAEKVDLEGRRSSVALKDLEQWLRKDDQQLKWNEENRKSEMYPLLKTGQVLSNKNAYQDYLNKQLSNVKTQGEIDLIKQAINNAKWDSKLKSAEYQMKKLGINSSDPSYLRLYTMSLGMDKQAFEKLMLTATIGGLGSALSAKIPKVNIPKKNLEALKPKGNHMANPIPFRERIFENGKFSHE